MPKITVHHLEKSRSHRVLWLLAELDLEYELVEYARDPKTIRAPRALRDVHPLGKSPVVVVDGLVLAESGAIIEHLVELTGRLAPPGDDARARVAYRYWMHYAEGSLMPPLLVRLIMDTLRNPPLPFFVKPLTRAVAGKVDEAFTQPEIDLHAGFLESQLADREYFCGDTFTAADVQMSYPVEALVERGRPGVSVTRLRAWCERMRSRPGFQAAIARGGALFVD